MKTAIKNLNLVIESRDKMIEDIIYWKHDPKHDGQWDKLEKRYSKKSYAGLKKIYDALNRY